MRHLSNEDFAETLSGGSQEAYNKKAEELHALTDTGKAQADIKKDIETLYKDHRDPDESVDLILGMNKTALLKSFVESEQDRNKIQKKLSALEEEYFDLEKRLKEAEDRCDRLEAVRAERDQAFREAGVIKDLQASAPN